MNRRTGNITVVRTAGACALSLAFLFVSGCMSPLTLEFEDQFSSCRVDNPDGDGLWDTGDRNGNGELDLNETSGQLIDFDRVSNSSPSNGLTTSQINSAPAAPDTLTTSGSIRINIVQPGFQEFNTTSNLLIDFDDLVVFSPFTSFTNQAYQRTNVQVQGVQLVRALRFSNHEEVKETDETEHFLELSSGARYFRLQDQYYFENSTGFLGRFVADTSMNNMNFGPQLGLKWGSSSRNWDINAEGIFLLGYNRIDGSQTGRLGEVIFPSQLNRPLYNQPTRFSNQQDNEDFSPIGEVRASASYQLTETLRVRVGYSAFYVGNMQYAQDAVVWRLPDLGISTSPDQDWLTETLYANIELRR